MTPIQFRNALRRLDCTISRAARLLGADERTARRWAAGDRGMPEAAAKLLRLAVAGKITLDDIEHA
jgi:DNA-binding transcriptional regulator YiaG